MNVFNTGDLVKSLCGRDCGKVFCVISLKDDVHCLIADGKYRRLDNPKLKKFKHLQKVGVVAEGLVEKLEKGNVIFDAELNKAIRQVIRDDE